MMSPPPVAVEDEEEDQGGVHPAMKAAVFACMAGAMLWTIAVANTAEELPNVDVPSEIALHLLITVLLLVLRDPEYQTPMRSIASFSSLSYSNNFEESTSHTLDLVTITELYTRDKRSRPPKQILDLVNKCMLFRISAKTEHLSKPDSAFPVFKVNTDQQLLKQHCPEILGIPEEEVNTEMLSLEDDEILEVKLLCSV
nr:replication factor A protein 1-like [Ipomoea batatas]